VYDSQKQSGPRIVARGGADGDEVIDPVTWNLINPESSNEQA
jgi:hypothetical protein